MSIELDELSNALEEGIAIEGLQRQEKRSANALSSLRKQRG